MNLQEIEEIEKRIERLGYQSVKLQQEAIALKELLEVQKPKEKQYTWKECFSGVGFALTGLSNMAQYENILDNSYENQNVATTEKVIESNLAACMLSHIIEAINKDFEAVAPTSCFYSQGYFHASEMVWALPYLHSVDAMLKLIETNKPLLLQYFGVKEK